MSWDPRGPHAIAMFEPGCIRCAECGWRPDDPWCDAPEGFQYKVYPDFKSGQWECDECIQANEAEEKYLGVNHTGDE